MIVRCTATSLIIRDLPNGKDTRSRLEQGNLATAYGTSFDGQWLYITYLNLSGWASKQFLEEFEDPGQKPIWIGAAEGNFRHGRALPIDMIVIHVIEGTLKSCDNWFNDPAAGVTAHYGIGLKREVHQYVKETDVAFHAGRIKNATAAMIKQRPGVNPNDYSIGIEHEGTATSIWPDTMYEDSANLVAQISKRYGIPINRVHVVGHHEIFEPKSCPGKGDVSRIVQMAKQITL